MARLGVRLAAVTLVVGLIGGLIGGWVVRRSTRDAIQIEAEHLMAGLAERLATEIDNRINGIAGSLRVVATREQITSLGPAAEVELAVALRALDDVEELDLFSADGRPIAGVAGDRLVDPSTLVLQTRAATGNQVVELVPGDRTALDITVAVEDPPGTVVAAMRGRVRLESIVQVLEARLLGSTAKAIFVGPDRMVLDHPERNRVLGREMYPIDSIPDGSAGSFTHNGVRVLAASARTSDLPGYVVIEWDESEALRLANRTATLVGLLVALVVLATVATMLVLTAQLLRPVESLRTVLRRFGEGDHDARVEEAGSLEFRQVAQEVNAMASAVTSHISDLKRTQAELAEAHVQFTAAFQQAPVAMAIESPAGEYLDVNPELCDLLGRSRDVLLGSNARVFTHPDDLAATEQAFADAATTRVAGFQLEKSYVRPDGRRVPTVTSVTCVRDDAGSLQYLIAHFVDLSALREAEARFERIVASSPDVFVVVDEEGRIEFVSRRVTDTFGYDPDQLVGQEIEILVPEHLRAIHVGHRRAHPMDVGREMGVLLELSGRRADGTEVPVEITLSPIEMHQRPRLLATVRDVTARRAGEAASRELTELRARQRQAIEINDNIVQGLTVARWSFDLGEIDDARRAVERTVETARLLVDRMLSVSGAIEPGALRREHPAEAGDE